MITVRSRYQHKDLLYLMLLLYSIGALLTFSLLSLLVTVVAHIRLSSSVHPFFKPYYRWVVYTFWISAPAYLVGWYLLVTGIYPLGGLLLVAGALIWQMTRIVHATLMLADEQPLKPQIPDL